MRQAGAAAESPMTLLREHLTALRALLAGEQVTVDGRYVKLDEVTLKWPPPPPPGPAAGSPESAPLVLSAATGERTLRLSGEVADGTVLGDGTGTDVVRRARALIDEGRARGHRTGKHPLVVYMAVAALDAGEAAGNARALAEAGADGVVIQPSEGSDLDPVDLVRFTAGQVRPLLPSDAR
jgi:alkanesulfonate monooxygenase SsuD/methylene tetrahydromethanopterin reductase-like flavin-dependent oxidoreductase (luciferase family)